MSFRDRMDKAYGRRGHTLTEFPQMPRPALGPNVMTRTDSTAKIAVEVVELLAGRRCRVKYVSNGATQVVADSWIEGKQP